jgi:hypothetical protein
MIIMDRRAFLTGTTAFAVSCLAPFRAMAQTPRTYRALLVACTAYPNLLKKYILEGPNNDAVLVRDYLLNSTPPSVKFAPDNITVLADGIDGASGSATHAAILAAFADLAAKAEQGDFIYVHLSGHGAQQPQAKEGDETDGQDEIFLSSDTKLCTDLSERLPNVLKDDEIRDALNAIRAKGAFVWTVFDCCHSGTATRAAEVTDETDRKVDFLDLVDKNIRAEAEKAVAAAEKASASRGFDEKGQRTPAFNLPTSAEPTGKGGLVAFYAAQSIETTPEMKLPKGTPDATKLGLFTFTIFSKLAENPNATYRQLGQAVLQQYLADGRTKPTPLFEGQLDAPVFGTESQDRAMQWPVKIDGSRITVQAGQLQRLTPGTKLAVLRDPRDEMSAAIGYVAVRSAKTLTSVLEPIDYDDKPKLKAAEIPSNAYVRIAELVVDYSLAVARPGLSTGVDTETALVNSVLDEILADKERGFNLVLVEAGQSADLRFAVLRENEIKDAAADATGQPGLWFLPASGDVTLKDGSRPPVIIIHADGRAGFVESVKKYLTTIYRATSLSRLAAAPNDPLDKLQVGFEIKRAATDEVVPLVGAEVPRASPGDLVYVTAKNDSGKYFDLNVLYVGSDYSISHMPAEDGSAASRLAPGASLKAGVLEFTDEYFGMERMIAVLTEVTAQRELEDLSYLAQDGVPQKTRDARAPDEPVSFSDMLLDIGLAPATRAAKRFGDKGGSSGAVMIYQIETVRPPA